MTLKKPDHLTQSAVSGFNLRSPTLNEMQTIFKMGEDVWASGQNEADYLAACSSSKKYNCGNWHLLLNSAGNTVCSSISYELPVIYGYKTIGIGSIATPKGWRKNGYALQLLTQLTQAYREQQNTEIFILFSDIENSLYTTAGFISLPNVSEDARMMVNVTQRALPALLDFSRTHQVSYF